MGVDSAATGIRSDLPPLFHLPLTFDKALFLQKRGGKLIMLYRVPPKTLVCLYSGFLHLRRFKF